MVNLLMMVNEPEDRLGTLPMPRLFSMLCARIWVCVKAAILVKNHRGRFWAMRS